MASRTSGVELVPRLAANLFSSALYRPFMLESRSPRLEEMLADYCEHVDIPRVSRATALSHAYRQLARGYRNEHYFKNTYINRRLAGRSGPGHRWILQEVSVSGAVADILTCDQHLSVVEIKTTFDGPAKLEHQVAAYRQVSSRVTILVDEREVERYLRYADTFGVGLATVRRGRSISELRAAPTDSSGLSVEAIIGLLRVAEIEGILLNEGSRAVQVPNGLRYRRLLDLARDVDPAVLQRRAATSLAKRGAEHSRGLLSEAKYEPIRATLLRIGATSAVEANVSTWLDDSVD